MSSQKFAVVAGVGPGTGGEIAKVFAKKYHVILLSRSPETYEPLVKEITSAGGKAHGFSADVTSGTSIKAAIDELKKISGAGDKTQVAAAIFNASGRFRRAPFLELTEDDFEAGYRPSCHGAFVFSQAVLPLLLNSVEATPSAGYYPPTLIFTGATASVKSNAQMAAFAPGKWALRAISQSLAREFGPKGVHVSHAIIDGVIDIPRTKEWQLQGEDAKISPVAIAENYWYLHTQPRTTFTWEVDIRPYIEKW